MARKKDFLDEFIDARTARNPDFPRLLAEAESRRALAKPLTKLREERRWSQTIIAGKMASSQSVVSKLEAGADVKLSTVLRYCDALDYELVWSFKKRGVRAHKAPAAAKVARNPRSAPRAAR